jgi:hypothetical protein
MSHDHSTAAHHDAPNSEPQSKTGLSSAFWLILVVAGLFVASLNFMQAMGGHEDGNTNDAHGGHKTIVPPSREATSNGTLSGETGAGKPAENVQHDAAAGAADSSMHNADAPPAAH